MSENPYQIWIAEDNPADVYLIEEALRRHEFTYRLDVRRQRRRHAEYDRQSRPGPFAKLAPTFS